MDTRKFKCTNCDAFIVAEVPQHDVVNHEQISMFMMIHPDNLVCKNCGQKFQFYITGIGDLKFGWKAIESKVADLEKGVITPPKNPLSRIQ